MNCWANACKLFKLHAKTHEHLTCLVAMNSRMTASVNVLNQQVKSHATVVLSNRENLAIIIRIVQLLSKQGLALRAHRESSQKNKGNFLETILFTGKIDSVFYKSRLDIKNLNVSVSHYS